MSNAPPRLADFIRQLDTLVAERDESRLLPQIAHALEELIAADDWLPDAYAVPDPDRYTQYLLYRDPAARFSVVSFVWGPGQGTPIHDHTIWGAVGVLRGAERSQRFAVSGNAPPQALGKPETLAAGTVETVSPGVGDVHQVVNAVTDAVTISIHVYGADIGKVERHIFPAEGGARRFISGYANDARTPPFAI